MPRLFSLERRGGGRGRALEEVSETEEDFDRGESSHGVSVVIPSCLARSCLGQDLQSKRMKKRYLANQAVS